MSRHGQRGATTVEFAIIGTGVMLVLFAVIEVGRAMFVLGALGESTRRAARIASVCPIGDPVIAEVALFNAPGSGVAGGIIGGLMPGNVAVDYLRSDGSVIADPTADFLQIRFVRARIVNFQHQMLVPFAERIFTTPDFATTVRRESLGVPRTGPAQAC